MIEAWWYARRRWDDTRNEDETIHATVRNSPTKTRPRDNTNETIRDDEDSAIRDEKSETIRDEKTLQYVTKRAIRCTTIILKKWAPGANNRVTLIYFTNLEISPAAPRSVCGRGAWFFLIWSAGSEREKAKQ